MENLNNNNGQDNQRNYLTNEESDFVRSDENIYQRDQNLINYNFQNDQNSDEIQNSDQNYNSGSNLNPNQNKEENEDELNDDDEDLNDNQELDEEDDNLTNQRQNRYYDSSSEDYENRIDQSFSGML